MHWLQRKKPQLSAKSQCLKKSRKPQKIVIFEKNGIFYGFYRFFPKWDFAESCGFLRSNQCIKTFPFSYQRNLLDDFHFLPYNGGVCFLRPLSRGGQTVFLVKMKNVRWFFMTEGTLNHMGQKKFGLVPP